MRNSIRRKPERRLDTTRVSRRKLRFATIDDVLADMDRIISAERAGTLRCTGNWTAGQTFAHLAAWIEYAYEGYPLKRQSWVIRLLLRWMLPWILRNGMPAGGRIPKAPGGTYGAEPVPIREASERLRAALRRLVNHEPALYDSPAFGRLSDEERIQLNLRHAELHLSFLHP
jgi:hypothetical protein